MSGGSRGIGLAILTAAAREGANAVLLAKTDTADPRRPGTVHTAVGSIEAAGASAVAVVGDVRDEADVERAVATAVVHTPGTGLRPRPGKVAERDCREPHASGAEYRDRLSGAKPEQRHPTRDSPEPPSDPERFTCASRGSFTPRLRQRPRGRTRRSSRSP